MKSEHAMEEVHFADETPPQKSESEELWKVMIVDDDDFVHKVTELTLGVSLPERPRALSACLFRSRGAGAPV